MKATFCNVCMVSRTFCILSLETVTVLHKNILILFMWWEFLNHPLFQHVHSLLGLFHSNCHIKKLLHLWDCIFLWTGTQFSFLQKSLFILLNSQTESYYNRDFWDGFPTLSSCIRTACLLLNFLKLFLIFVRWILLLLKRAQFLCWTLSCLKMQFLLHIF